ncbi:MAG: hypothetical protein KJ574_00245 [Nanoarchaeota archaeon]|nr:hypothetical protein [Nanoarchaeota archaeon]
MAFNLFQKKTQTAVLDSKLAFFSTKISEAFSKVREQLAKSDHRMKTTEEELSRLNQWVGYLYHNHQQLSGNQEKLADKHSQLHNSHSKLIRSHNNLSKAIELKHSQIKSDISGTHTLTAKEFENMKDWIKHFSEKIENQRDIEAKLRKDVLMLQSQLFGVMSELREEVSKVKAENVKLHEKLESISVNASPKIIEKIVEVERPSVVMADEPRFSPAQNKFEQQILARVRPNRRNFVMQQILEMIEDNKRSTKEVEDIIVKEKQLCGRTSFYSYLRELKHKGKINYADVGDKTILVMMDKKN